MAVNSLVQLTQFNATGKSLWPYTSKMMQDLLTFRTRSAIYSPTYQEKEAHTPNNSPLQLGDQAAAPNMAFTMGAQGPIPRRKQKDIIRNTVQPLR